MYTTLESVLAELPAGEPDNPVTKQPYTEEEWQAKVNSIIQFNTSYIDEAVNYPVQASGKCFPVISDDPTTPATIEKICRYLTRCDALVYFSGTYKNSENAERLRLRNWAEATIKKVRNGELVIKVSGAALSNCALGAVPERDEAVFTDESMEVR